MSGHGNLSLRPYKNGRKSDDDGNAMVIVLFLLLVASVAVYAWMFALPEAKVYVPMYAVEFVIETWVNTIVIKQTKWGLRHYGNLTLFAIDVMFAVAFIPGTYLGLLERSMPRLFGVMMPTWVPSFSDGLHAIVNIAIDAWSLWIIWTMFRFLSHSDD